MPHCVIEYSNDLEEKDEMIKTVEMINRNLVDSELFDKKTIKTRAISISTYLIGDEKIPFIHTTIRLLKGRTNKQKKILSKNILNTLSNKYHLLKDISVEVIDINPNCYSKN
jgi:5-carboxymethyl-2-hydroxymuconate isomerase